MAAVQDSMSRFILKWAGANTVGWLAAAVLALPFLLLYQPLHKGIAGAAIGIGLGAGQWLLMRHYLEKAGWWIVVTVVGFAVGGALMGFGTTEELSKRGLSRETVGFVLGATAGVAQWTVLRRRSPRAIWWIPASIGAFGFGLVCQLERGLWFCIRRSPGSGCVVPAPADPVRTHFRSHSPVDCYRA